MRIDNQIGLSQVEQMQVTKVTKAGAITEAVSMAHIPRDTGIRRLDKDQYVNINTGEVGQYRHTESRAENIKNVKRTLHWIRLLVNGNVTDAKNALWVTLTYAENMTDRARLYDDFKVYWKRLCRWCISHGYDKPRYISVVEPQGRGAWHCHLFLLWNSKAPYIPNDEVMETLWEHGWTTTKAIKDCDNIGAYFSAYLADIPVEEAKSLPAEDYKLMQENEVVLKSFENEQETIKDKKFIKGGRLYLYPTGMSIVRHSRDIIYPEEERMTSEQWQEKKRKEKSQLGTLTFSSTSILYGDDDEIMTVIHHEHYNRNRIDDVKLKGENNG